MPRNIKVSLFLDRRNSFFLSVNFTEETQCSLIVSVISKTFKNLIH